MGGGGCKRVGGPKMGGDCKRGGPKIRGGDCKGGYQKFGGGIAKGGGYQKWPRQIFPAVNFRFSPNGHFGLGGRGMRGVLGEPPPPFGFQSF